MELTIARHGRCFTFVVAFLGMLAGLPLTQARADVILSLNGVTFDDGGSAVDQFGLNFYGFVDDLSVGLNTSGPALGSQLYTGNPSGFVSGGGTMVDFGQLGNGYDLHLVVAQPMTSYGTGTIILLPSSYETCTFNCGGGVTPGTIRYLTSGSLDVPEPATIVILGLSPAGLSLTRRRRTQSA